MTTIKTIRLMDGQEYEEFYKLIPKVDKRWFLSAPGALGNSNYISVVGLGDGVFSELTATPCGVRPVICLTSDNHSFNVEEKVTNLFGMTWTVFSICDGDALALCDDIVAERPFNDKLTEWGKNNVWETSTLKTWLEEWLEYSILGLEDEIVYEPLTVSSFLKEIKSEKVKDHSWMPAHSDKECEKSDRVKSYDIDCDDALNPAIKTWTSSLTDDDYKRWSRSETEKMVEELKRLLKKR